VGGANIVEMVEAATGINLWREWARIEVADARGDAYTLPATREDYAGLLVSLARQEWPDTSAYDDPEIVWRMNKRHHVGMILASPSPDRVAELLGSYMHRVREDLHARVGHSDGLTNRKRRADDTKVAPQAITNTAAGSPRRWTSCGCCREFIRPTRLGGAQNRRRGDDSPRLPLV
jgi:hypothetical protein